MIILPALQPPSAKAPYNNLKVPDSWTTWTHQGVTYTRRGFSLTAIDPSDGGWYYDAFRSTWNPARSVA